MLSTVILPYTSDRTTTQDINYISKFLYLYDPSIRFLSFDIKVEPIALAKSFSPKTITVTLNNNARSPIFDFIPGPKYFAPQKSKTRLALSLLKSEVSMPYTEPFSLEIAPDESRFGIYTAIKTTAPRTFQGTGIYVFKTREFAELRNDLLNLYKQDISAGYIPLLQQYIQTGQAPVHTCILTFLGAPIVCFKTEAPSSFDLKSLKGLSGHEATSNSQKTRKISLCYDEDMVELAKAVSNVFSETSVLGIDMVRCVDTNRIYCIEVNLSNLCVLSAPMCRQLRHKLGSEALHAQFGSYETIARRMINALWAI